LGQSEFLVLILARAISENCTPHRAIRYIALLANINTHIYGVLDHIKQYCSYIFEKHTVGTFPCWAPVPGRHVLQVVTKYVPGTCSHSSLLGRSHTAACALLQAKSPEQERHMGAQPAKITRRSKRACFAAHAGWFLCVCTHASAPACDTEVPRLCHGSDQDITPPWQPKGLIGLKGSCL